MTSQDKPCDGVATLRLALFASVLSVLLALLMLVLRTGLPTPLQALALGPTITGCATLGPALWAQRCDDARHQLWLGPVAVLALLVGCALAALGLVGQVLLSVAFVSAVVRSVAVLRRPAMISGGHLGRWALLLLAAGLLAALLIDGTKYLNFIADQLALYGRTDGDVLFHGAITNAFRSFGFPSTGIDGLKLLRYHSGLDALAALIANGPDADAVFALILLRVTILFPLAIFALAWAAGVYGRLLLPGLTFRPLALATAAVVLGLLQQAGSFPALILANDPLLQSGVLLTLLAPAVIVTLIERPAAARLALVTAVAAIPLISMTKISTGAIWCAVTGYLVLRRIGPRRIGFWITGMAMAAVFGGCVWLASDPGQAGAELFGTPFYVEYGFQSGNYLLPLTIHFYLIILIVSLLRLRGTVPEGPRRLAIEAFAVTAAAANVPVLILRVPGGDIAFFLHAVSWLLAAPVAMLVAAVPHWIGRAAPQRRRVGWSLVSIALLAAVIDGGVKSGDRVNVAVAGAALLHTGDLTYYADDKRRGWREGKRRALKDHGLFGLYRLPPPAPPGAGLAAALAATRHDDARTAAYIPPDAPLWNLVKDCDGRSLWPMAVSGVPLIDGYVPDQSACEQTFALIGYGTPPARRVPLDDAELCRRASAAGFTRVLEVESLEDRGKDRLIACR